MRWAAWAVVLGVLFTISWQNAYIAPTQIQYATTPTSTWKTLVTAAAGDNSFTSKADNNTITRGRFYYFRLRHVFDNGAGPWSPKVGAVWLTGAWPEDNTFLIQKTDNAVISFKGGSR